MARPDGVSVDVLTFPTRDEQAAALARRVADDLGSAIVARGRASLAVPGGTTPAAFLDSLATHGIDWPRVRVTLTDERLVPADDPRSNARLVRENLIRLAAGLRFVPLAAPDGAPRADAVESLLPLDVCVLGMGADAHTASLFPGADGLDAALDPAAPGATAVLHPPGVPEARITLTARALLSASCIYVLIAGPDKRAALDRALGPGPEAEAPVRAVLRGPRPAVVYYAP